MRLPTLTETSKSKDINDAFAGYNHNLVIGNGEFYDMMGMTSDYYPIMSPKKHKKLQSQNLRSGAMIFHDGLIYTDGTKLNVYGTEIELGLATDDVSLHQQRLIEFGSYILVFPDRKYVNTSSAGYSDRGDIDELYDSWFDYLTQEVTTDATTTFKLCDESGSAITVDYTQSSPPSDTTDGKLWIDTSGNYHTLKKYSSFNSGWIPIQAYTRIEFYNVALKFAKNDGVKITIETYPGASSTARYKKNDNTFFSSDQLDALCGYHNIVVRLPFGNLVVEGMIDETTTIKNRVRVERSIPKIDYVIEAGNRLWGCRYGTNSDGEKVNEIYASALGDFKQWYKFDGVSTDSYVASIGTNGPWTGAINYRGIPCFFKQNHVHMVYGDYPAQYQINEMTLDGVGSSDSKSLAIVDGVLYYKSEFGFMAFNGSTAEKLNDVFGDVRLNVAVAGEIDGQYFVCAGETTNGANREYKGRFIFVYDTKLGVWMKRSKENVIQFCRVGDSLLTLTELEGDYYPLDPEAEDARTNKMWVEHCKRTVSNEKVEWFTESGKIGMYLTAKKYISRIAVRLSLSIGSLVRIYIQYDSDGKWNPILSVRGTSLKSFYLPIRPHRCDHFRIRIEGIGEAKIYSIDKTIEEGSEH